MNRATTFFRILIGASTQPINDRTLHHPNPIRLLLIMLSVWALHMLDLNFTLNEAAKGQFHELNPVADIVLRSSLTGIVLYKFALLGGATAILWVLREHAITERASWLLLITAVMLTIRWQMYYDLAPEHPLTYMQPLAIGP
jgi:hypothetical protein